tara:strand:- start:12896 stop:13216 length:321 start_codon:yes stop_codon:yes gene_type:complete
MNINEFYSSLSNTSSTYNWSVGSQQAITATGTRGKTKGVTLNPITAVAYRKGLGTYGSNKRESLRAGRDLGLTKTFSENVYQATTNYSNRGNSQVVRGRILSALEM